MEVRLCFGIIYQDLSQTIATGYYELTNDGAGNYVVSRLERTFTNQPNQNDGYLAAGGSLSALVYRLFEDGLRIDLSDDGTYRVLKFST